MPVKKAIIPCAGFGTRFLPVTKALPKELLPIVDTPALSYIVEEASKSGIEEVCIVISPQKRAIKRLFYPNLALNKRLKAVGNELEYALANKDYKVKISFAVQRKMNGNAMAIYKCKRFANGEPVAVLFGDDVMYTEGKPVTKQLIDAYDKTGGATIVGCQKTDEDVARRCGVMIERKALDERTTAIDGIIEKPRGDLPSSLVSLGRFVLSPDIFDAIKRTKAVDGEIYLTDAISMLAHDGKAVCAYEFEARRYDIGNKEGYLEAVVDYALRDEKLRDGFMTYIDAIKR